MKEMYVVYDNAQAEDEGIFDMIAALHNEADAQELIMDLAEETFYLAFLARLQRPWFRVDHVETDEEIIQIFSKRTIADWSWRFWYDKVVVLED